MNRWMMLTVMAMGLVLFASCNSIPQQPNLTGKWSYTLTDHLSGDKFDGSMNLAQDVYNVKGKANDAFGEFNVSGTVNGPTFVLKFAKNDKSLNYTLNLKMTSAESCSGTYTTTAGKAGLIKVKRIQ